MIEKDKMTNSAPAMTEKQVRRAIARKRIHNISLACFLGTHKKCDKIPGDCDCECHPGNRFISRNGGKNRSDGRFNKV